jgi:AraC-like DNA-binding protein
MDFTVLEARSFVSPCHSHTTRLVKDYEIDMECSSDRIYTCGEIRGRRLVPGDVVVKKPSDIATMTGVQNTFMLTLDFSGKSDFEAYSRNISGEIQPIFENEAILRLEPIIHPANSGEIAGIYRRLISITDKNSPAAHELVRVLIYMLNAEISRKNYEILKTEESVSEAVISYMREHLDAVITLDELSRRYHLEKSYLSRLFRRETGKTPIETLIEMRLDRASDLIASTDLSISKIASECGYNTVSFFISAYKKRYGITPETHRKTIKR